MNTELQNPASPLITIIVPFRDWDQYTQECVEACGRLDTSGLSVDLWLLPDAQLHRDSEARLREAAPHLDITIRPTGPVNPGTKRNVALRESSAETFALIDADATPREDWLQKAIPELTDKIAVVAGPNLTPPCDPLLQRVTGRVMESPLGFGAAHIRHIPVSRRIETEMPTCNMALRRLPDLLFRENFDTDEDMMYCADVRNRGFKILYTPDVVVYHHRRPLGLAFALQFFHYGLDKGRLFATDRAATHLWQLAPALLTIYVFLIGPALLVAKPLWLQWSIVFPGLLYLAAIFV